jgi:hypothetical protein
MESDRAGHSMDGILVEELDPELWHKIIGGRVSYKGVN